MTRCQNSIYVALVYYNKITGNTQVLANKQTDVPPVALTKDPSWVKAVIDGEDLKGLCYSASEIAERYLDFYNKPIFILSGSSQQETEWGKRDKERGRTQLEIEREKQITNRKSEEVEEQQKSSSLDGIGNPFYLMARNWGLPGDRPRPCVWQVWPLHCWGMKGCRLGGMWKKKKTFGKDCLHQVQYRQAR